MLREKLSSSGYICVLKCEFNCFSIKEIRKSNVKLKNTAKGILIVLKNKFKIVKNIEQI